MVPPKLCVKVQRSNPIAVKQTISLARFVLDLSAHSPRGAGGDGGAPEQHPQPPLGAAELAPEAAATPGAGGCGGARKEGWGMRRGRPKTARLIMFAGDDTKISDL